jgi:hypothetical protein
LLFFAVLNLTLEIELYNLIALINSVPLYSAIAPNGASFGYASALLANIRLCSKQLTMANILSSFDAENIMSLKFFIRLKIKA